MKRFLCLLLVFTLAVSFTACAPNPQDVDGWTLETEETLMPANGITYLERTYFDENGAPYRAYILLLDPNKVTLKTGTSNNGYELIPAQKQTVRDHALAALSDGVHVLAAVNGDFFAIASSYMPSGLSIKDGKLIRLNSNNRPFCAVTKNGEYLISRGAVDQVDVTTLDMAVGGSHVLIWDGEIQSRNPNDTFGIIASPRTLSGETADGTIILAVIDGRQPALSNGATLTQCAQLMRSLGAVTAINHDGGGSSTCVLRNGSDFLVMNSPSDGVPRKVFCSILVVEK